MASAYQAREAEAIRSMIALGDSLQHGDRRLSPDSAELVAGTLREFMAFSSVAKVALQALSIARSCPASSDIPQLVLFALILHRSPEVLKAGNAALEKITDSRGADHWRLSDDRKIIVAWEGRRVVVARLPIRDFAELKVVNHGEVDVTCAVFRQNDTDRQAILVGLSNGKLAFLSNIPSGELTFKDYVQTHLQSISLLDSRDDCIEITGAIGENTRLKVMIFDKESPVRVRMPRDSYGECVKAVRERSEKLEALRKKSEAVRRFFWTELNRLYGHLIEEEDWLGLGTEADLFPPGVAGGKGTNVPPDLQPLFDPVSHRLLHDAVAVDGMEGGVWDRASVLLRRYRPEGESTESGIPAQFLAGHTIADRPDITKEARRIRMQYARDVLHRVVPDDAPEAPTVRTEGGEPSAGKS